MVPPSHRWVTIRTHCTDSISRVVGFFQFSLTSHQSLSLDLLLFGNVRLHENWSIEFTFMFGDLCIWKNTNTNDIAGQYNPQEETELKYQILSVSLIGECDDGGISQIQILVRLCSLVQRHFICYCRWPLYERVKTWVGESMLVCTWWSPYETGCKI